MNLLAGDVDYGHVVGLVRFLFFTMTVRYGRGLMNRETRLWHAPAGPLLVAAGFALIFLRFSPTIAVAVLVAGSAIMHIQASMVERAPWKSLRNGGLIVLGWTLLLGWTTRDWVGLVVGVLIAAALFWLHAQHEREIASGVRPRSIAMDATD